MTFSLSRSTPLAALALLSAVIASVMTLSALGDVVILKNGDRITGQILNEGPPKLTIQTTYAGEIEIARNNVSRIERGGAVAVVTNTAPIERAPNMAANGKEPVLEAKSEAVEFEDKKEWEGSVNLSMQLENGRRNADREIDGDMRLRWSRDHQRFRLDAMAEYDTINRDATKQDWMVVPKYDHYFTDQAYWSLSYAAKQEKYEGLNLRQTMGPALGYEFFSNENNELISEVGIYYTTEDYTNGSHTSYAAPGWNLEYRRKVYQDRIEFYHRHFFFVRADDSGQRIWHSWTGFKFPIAEGFNLSTELELDYDDITLNRTSNLEDTIRLKFGYDW